MNKYTHIIVSNYYMGSKMKFNQKSGPQGLALAIAPALEKDPRVHVINFWKCCANWLGLNI
jgi:hypothetical protein